MPISLLHFSILMSVLALLMMAAGFVWLARRDKFEKHSSSGENTGHAVMNTVMSPHRPVGKTWFKGTGWSVGWSAAISTREVVDMVRQGRWSEAGPWLITILGAYLAFFFWPLFVMIVCEAPPFAAWGLALFFFGYALYAGWPRKN